MWKSCFSVQPITISCSLLIQGEYTGYKGYEIPEAGRTARGTAIINLLQLQPEEKITAVIPIKEYEEGKYLFMATKKGLVKKTPIMDYANVRKTGLRPSRFGRTMS